MMDATKQTDNQGPAQASKPRRRPKSFVLKITMAQFFRMLKVLLLVDLVALVTVGFLFVLNTDQTVENLVQMDLAEARQSARLIEGLTISHEEETGYGFFTHRQLERIGLSSANVRILSLEPSNEQTILWGLWKQPVYAVTTPVENGYLRASFDLTRQFNQLWYASLIVLGIEFFILMSNTSSARQSVRRTLAPIQQLAVATQNITSVPVGRMEGAAGRTRLKEDGQKGRKQEKAKDNPLEKFVVAGEVKGRKKRRQTAYQRPVATKGYRPPEELKLSGTIDTLNKITAKHLDARIPIEHEREELRGLASAVNSMLDRLDAAYSSQLRFVSDASHELRTPIAVLQGYANMLDRWGKEDPAVLQESIEAIKAESEGMKILVEQLLFLARGDNNTIAMKVQTLDVCDFASDVVRETKLIDQGHEFVSDFPGALWVEGDMALLKQALRVFVDNAVKYSPAGGRIKISAATDGEWTRVSVTDNGIGIPEDDLPHVFERFFRSDESRARATGGTGLGLSIAKWIVERHGGFLEIISREEIGTRLTMVLPVAAEPTGEEEDEAPEDAG